MSWILHLWTDPRSKQYRWMVFPGALLLEWSENQEDFALYPSAFWTASESVSFRPTSQFDLTEGGWIEFSKFSDMVAFSRRQDKALDKKGWML